MFSLASCGVNHLQRSTSWLICSAFAVLTKAVKLHISVLDGSKNLGTVEPEVLYFQPGFFPDFPHHGVFFCLTAVHISSHQNIRGLAVPHSKQCF